MWAQSSLISNSFQAGPTQIYPGVCDKMCVEPCNGNYPDIEYYVRIR